MKKTIFIILTLFVFSPILVGAIINPGDIPTNTDVGIPKSPINKPENFLTAIAKAVQYIYALFFIVAVAFILFAAFDYLSGGDNTEKIKTAHKKLTYAAIAIAVALLAVSFRVIILQFLQSSGGGGGNINTSSQPTQTFPHSTPYPFTGGVIQPPYK
ncbi:MAG: hypothetical protein AAB696_00010 [Patescibacteria group bacterium]